MQKADRSALKTNNRRLILSELKKRGQSRTELARTTGLSSSTVSGLVGGLIKSGAVLETELARSSGGRRPVMLKLDPGASYAVVVRVEPLRVTACLVDLGLGVAASSAAAAADAGAESLEDALRRAVRGAAQAVPGAAQRICGTAVDIAGLVDYESGTIIYSNNLRVRNFPVARVIGGELGAPVHIFKDADALMLGELAHGSVRGGESCVYILVDEGLGMSYMDSGEVLHFSRSGFELGHIPLESAGPQCTCGKFGCAEAFVSGWAARRDLKLAAGSAEQAELYARMSLGEIVRRSGCGDSLCRGVLSRQCASLGKAAAIAVNIFAPDSVIIGGPLGAAQWDVCREVRSAFEANVIDGYGGCSVRLAGAESRERVIGLAGSVFESELFASRF